MPWSELTLTPIDDDTWVDIDSSGNPHFVYYYNAGVTGER